MRLKRLDELFDVRYGSNLELNALTSSDDGINFVSRSSRNNGVVAKVQRVANLEPTPSGVLTVAGGGSVLETFLQPEPFYSGRDLYYLTPKLPMSDAQKLFYCQCIRSNKFRYNYGRQANKTLRSLLLPSLDFLPKWTQSNICNSLNEAKDPAIEKDVPSLTSNSWRLFKFSEVFEIKKGYYNKKPPVDLNASGIPFIGATEFANGVTAYISLDNLTSYSRDGSMKPEEDISRKLFQGSCITVSNNGSVGEAFYQPSSFTCSHDVNPLYLLDASIKLTPAIGMFLAAVIRMDKYRWGFGRKWRPTRMPNSMLALPVTSNGEPDWIYMENYINTLPYSSQI